MTYEYTTAPNTPERRAEVIDRINHDWAARIDKLKVDNPHLGFFELRHLMATREYGIEIADRAYGPLKYEVTPVTKAPV